MTVLITIQLLATGLLGLLVVGLLRSHAEILRSLRELGAGDPTVAGDQLLAAPVRRRPVATGPATDVVGSTPRGGTAAVGVTGVEHATILAFLSSGCMACHAFWEEFARGDLALPGDTRLAVVTKDPAEESESRIRALAPSAYPTVMSSAAWREYSVPATPHFVLVDGPSGQVVGEGSASTWTHVLSLLRQAMDDAGIAAERSRTTHPHADREGSRIDRDLAAAGIHPGHPSLYPGRGAREGG